MAELVFDASVVIRGILGEGDAGGLFDQLRSGETRGHAPDVIVAEVANAIALAARVEQQPLTEAVRRFRLFDESPLTLYPVRPMATAAIELAVRTGLSAYDAFYAELSATLELPLVTADRKLAAAVPGTLLVA